MRRERPGGPGELAGWGGALVLLVVMIVLAALQAARRPFWHDEIYTITAATVPRLADVFHLTQSGADMMPPLNAIVTFAIVQVTGVNEVSARVPAMLGFGILMLVVFAAVKERAGVVPGWSAMLITYFSVAFAYAYEARGYGLLLGLTSLAWYAWARAAASRRRRAWLVTLGLATAAAGWTHYYAVFALIPMLAGELVRWRQRGHPDAGVAVAVAVGLVAMLPLVPGLVTAAGAADTYWHRAHWADVAGTYRFLAGFLLGRRFLLLAGVVGLLLVWGTASRRRGGPAASLPWHERVAVVGILGLPLVAVATAMVSTGVMVPRYVLPALVAYAVIPPWIVWRCSSGQAAGAVLLAGLSLAFAQSTATLVRDRESGSVPLLATVEQVARASRRDVPIVVTGTEFLAVWYYARPDVRPRLRYVADPGESVRLTGTDTVDRGYLALQDWLPIVVDRYQPFITTPGAFILCPGESSWLSARLDEEQMPITRMPPEAGPCRLVTRTSRGNGGRT